MKKVAVIDDDPYVAEIARRIVEENGFEVRSYSSSQDALENLVDWKPDLILLDIVMPKLDGFEFLRLIRTISPQVKAILMSGGFNHIEESDCEKIMRDAHADGWISKPFTMETVAETIRAVLS